MPAGSGRLALSVSQKMLRAGGVGDAAEFDIERIAATPTPGLERTSGDYLRWSCGTLTMATHVAVLPATSLPR